MTTPPDESGERNVGEGSSSRRQSSFESLYQSLLFGYAKSFVLKAVMELGIPDILAKAGGQLTLNEIAAKLPSKTVQLDFLSRIMSYASVNHLFTELSDPNVEEMEQGQRLFGLTPISSLLLEDSPGTKPNLVPMTKFALSKNFVEPWLNFSAAVLSGIDPFQLTHERSMWELVEADPEWGKTVNNAMASNAKKVLSTVLKVYKGFEDIKHLVDVGGGLAASLTSITQAYPEIQGINFDLPHVVANAPEVPGVKHVGGNMFKSVPGGDAIFMKNILHDWTDEECIQILKNCYKALPKQGKVILVEKVLKDAKAPADGIDVYDLAMLATTSGKERTAPEWHRVLKAAGFERVSEIIPAPPYCVLEVYKS